MLTVVILGPYRVVFYSGDGAEPPHVHVQRDDGIAKFWLSPVRLARSGGFNRRALLEIERIVTAHRDQLLEAWNEYFGE